MRLDDKLNGMFNEIEVPDELSPKNIAIMLKAKTEQSKMIAEHKDIKSASSIAAQRRTIIMRTVAASAACAVFAVGMLAYNKTNPKDQVIDPRIDFEAISPDSYDDLFNIYTGISLDSSIESGTDINTGTEKPVVPETSTSVTKPPVKSNETVRTTIETELSADSFSDFEDERISKADVVKSDGTNLYCISDDMLYVVDIETMEIIAFIEHGLNPPVELYIEGESLILISKETDEALSFGKNDLTFINEDYSISENNSNDFMPEDEATAGLSAENSNAITQNSDNNNGDNPVFIDGAAFPEKTALNRYNVIIDIYDVSDKTFPAHTTTYKQNGNYITSFITGGILYTVTDYSDYREKPLDKQADLDTFVPAYYLNGEKHHIAANDIIIPSNANNTDYTVVSAMNCSNPDNSISVKAVLGSSKNICCSADSIYIVGVGKKGRDYSVITRFSLGRGEGLTYKASAAVEGTVINQSSMNVYNGMFRIAAKIIDDSGTVSTSVYMLDDSLNIVNSAGKLLPGEKVNSVRFEENYTSLFIPDKKEPAIVIDLSSSPPIQAQSLAGNASYLYRYSSDALLGLNYAYNEGGAVSGIELNMYRADSGLLINSVSFADKFGNVNSKALESKRALFFDSKKSLIGVPVYSYNEFGTVNQYYIYNYNDVSGFVLKGIIEYIDIDDKLLFERAFIKDEVIYIIGGKRIVSAQLSDLKIINSLIC